VFEWLAQQRDQPFLLYVHVTDPHAPYAPPSPFAERLADASLTAPPEDVRARLRHLRRNPQQATADDVRALVARYDGEVAFVDAHFGRLLDELVRLGVYDDTVVVLTADNGEEFFDLGGFEHGRTLYDELLSIPLVARLPHGANAGMRSSILARQIDVLPTVLHVLGIDIPATVHGRSLLAQLGAADDVEDAMTQTLLGSRDLEALVIGSWKVIQVTRPNGEAAEIYDTAKDPDERHNRAAERPVLLGYARQRLSAWGGRTATGTSRGDAPPIDRAIIERLRALGYDP
jgi:arylsulfatase A-like enzyme